MKRVIDEYRLSLAIMLTHESVKGHKKRGTALERDLISVLNNNKSQINTGSYLIYMDPEFCLHIKAITYVEIWEAYIDEIISTLKRLDLFGGDEIQLNADGFRDVVKSKVKPNYTFSLEIDIKTDGNIELINIEDSSLAQDLFCVLKGSIEPNKIAPLRCRLHMDKSFVLHFDLIEDNIKTEMAAEVKTETAIENQDKKTHFEPTSNKIFFGNVDKLADWVSEDLTQRQIIDKVRLMLKNYLELDNVSFLFGSGTSIHLGAISIRNFPIEVEDYVEKECLEGELYSTINSLQADIIEDKIDQTPFKDKRGWEFVLDEKVIRDNESGEIAIEYEKVLNYLIAKDYVLHEDKSLNRTDSIGKLITAIKEGLFEACNVGKRPVCKKTIERKNASTFDNDKSQGQRLEGENKYLFHEKFIKALLQRPLNLRRANIFTANYDLAFEYAFDRLGVHYIDGFAGFHKRFFKPETFEYDIFYPGSTTSGKVQRIEKVVKYFKLHGSLSWVNSESIDANNLYGIEEKPLELIDSLKKKGDVIIYPSAVKKSYTLDLPYSELFRQFASTISQPQSVLITIGYSFGDEHFNDIIYQALSNPTFTLIIVDFQGTKNENIKKIMKLNDPRVIILEGNFFGDFLTFADILMPNFNKTDINDEVAKTLSKLLGTNTIDSQSDTQPQNK